MYNKSDGNHAGFPKAWAGVVSHRALPIGGLSTVAILCAGWQDDVGNMLAILAKMLTP